MPRIEFEGAVHDFPDDFSDADIAAALGAMRPPQQQGVSAGISPAVVAASDVFRRGALRAGEQVATSPNVSRIASSASRPAAQMIGRAVGVSGGLPGYIAGEALTSPAVTSAAGRGIQSGAGFLARLAASPEARAVTGLPGLLGSMVTNPGDRPAGETPATTSQRTLSFAEKFKQDVNRQAGREIITGQTAPEILDSIARYKGQR
jgi:hypothetical protein